MEKIWSGYYSMRRVSIGTKTEDNLYLHNKNPCYIQYQKYHLKSYIRIRKVGGKKFSQN
jgi:hypothetical protein